MADDPRTMAERCADLIQEFAEVRLLVVGDLMLDRYVRGVVDRISPEAPVPIVRVEGPDEERLGGAGNVAANAAALGAQATVCAVVGDDAAGVSVRRLLGGLGVDDAPLVEIPGRPTTSKTRVLAQRQQVCRIDRELDVALEGHPLELVRESVEAQLGDVDAVVVSDYDKGVVGAELLAVLAAARRAGVPVVVDPKPPHLLQAAGATVLTPNLREATTAAGVRAGREGIERVVAHLLPQLDGTALLVTLGEEGMRLCTADGAVHAIAAHRREVFDVTGAGDTVATVVALALAVGGELVEAAELANLAAAVVVGKSGAATVTPSELAAVAARPELLLT